MDNESDKNDDLTLGQKELLEELRARDEERAGVENDLKD